MKRILQLGIKIFLGLLFIVFTFSVYMYNYTKGNYAVSKTVEFDERIPHIKIDDEIFHAETFGSDTNEVVVVIHGGPGNDYRYLLPIRALADSYFVIFYDQRGTGLSPRVEAEELSLESSLQDLSKIIDFYAPGQTVKLIGHSWGAMLASGYVARFPERVDKLVLAEPGMLTTEKGKEFFDEFKMRFSWKALKEMTIVFFESFHIDELDGHERMDYIYGSISSMDIKGNPMERYFCDGLVKQDLIPKWRYGSTSAQSILGKAIDAKGDFYIDLVSGLENFNKEVLFITGSCNSIIGTDFQQEHMGYFNKSYLVEIEDSGHMMFGEKPKESLSAIRGYFDRIN
jgi:proline iminopeptidase